MSQPTFIAKRRIADDLAASLSEKTVAVSVVVPLFDEADTLEALAKQIQEALGSTSHEIVFVDDGSRDQSWERIQRLAAVQPNIIRGFRHRRNRGKAEALATGFAQACGRKVVTIDADLQDDPAEIPALVAKLDEGYDLVSGWKKSRKDPLSKTIPSRLFNFAARVASGLPLHDFNCGLKAYRREAIADLRLYGELHRFIPILVQAEGFRVTELPVRHFPRRHGQSKYGWKRFAKGALDLVTVVMLTRYLKRPGHFFGALGLASGSLGVCILGYLSIMKIFFDQGIDSRPLFFFGILATLFGGQLITTGFIGEFLLRHKADALASGEIEQTPQAHSDN